ncbi:MAG: hypothetical protein L0227_19330, partial [Chloroflexi bacterium]|nr:hypothetical protein [Chloroflexota bacterium]
DEPTDPPTEETVVDPTDEPTDPPTEETVVDPTDQPTDPAGTPPTQSVLGEVSADDDIELPPTDAVANVATTTSSIFRILGLAGLAGAAFLLAPHRRRDPEATE